MARKSSGPKRTPGTAVKAATAPGSDSRVRPDRVIALLIALIWLVHPIQTESVTYTIQRSESLMGLFFLVTLYCVIRMAASDRAWWWGAAAAVSLLCGVGTKGGVILSAPVVIALYDRIYLARSWSRVFRERWGLYVALLAACGSFPFMLATAPEEWKESAGLSYGASPLEYGLAQPGRFCITSN
jgi:hypothetical protein